MLTLFEPFDAVFAIISPWKHARTKCAKSQLILLAMFEWTLYTHATEVSQMLSNNLWSRETISKFNKISFIAFRIKVLTQVSHLTWRTVCALVSMFFCGTGYILTAYGTQQWHFPFWILKMFWNYLGSLTGETVELFLIAKKEPQ